MVSSQTLAGWLMRLYRSASWPEARIPHVHLSSLARGLGRICARSPGRCMRTCPRCSQLEAAVGMCVLGECVLSSATELPHSVDGQVPCSHCVLCGYGKRVSSIARLAGVVTCTYVLMAYRVQNNI